MRVSVVVPTYQRREGALRCLEAVLHDTGTWEALVVVDGSTDGTEESIRERFGHDDRLRVVVTPNRGQMLAQRTGAALARGEIVLFLDDDVQLAPGTVSGHLRRHKTGSAEVIVGHMPCQLNGLGPEHWPVRVYQSQYERKIALWTRDQRTILDHMWGGNVSIRKSAWESLPPYPGDLPLGYHMDWELGLRCRFAGLTAAFHRELGAVHHQKRDLAGFLRDRRRSADDRIRVHQWYASQLGPLPLSHFTQDTSRLTGMLIRRRRVTLAVVMRVGLMLAMSVATQLRMWAWQRRCALDVASLEGALELLRREPGRCRSRGLTRIRSITLTCSWSAPVRSALRWPQPSPGFVPTRVSSWLRQARR